LEIKKLTQKIKMLTDEELLNLIPAARNGDANAIEQLCQKFAPLILKISHRQTVYNVLGEDAENTLWVWFLELLASYTGNDYLTFPGFVRKHLVLRIMNIFKYYNVRFNAEQLSTMDENSPIAEIPTEDKFYSLLDKLSIEQEFDVLTNQQSVVLKRFYDDGASIEQIALDLKMAPRTVRYHRAKAVYKLKKRLGVI